jgi:hypothetical protein
VTAPAAGTTHHSKCAVHYCSSNCQAAARRYHPYLCGKSLNFLSKDSVPAVDDYAIVNAQLVSVAHLLARLRCHDTQPHQPWSYAYGLHLLQSDLSKSPNHLSFLNRTPRQYQRVARWYPIFIRTLGLDERSCSIQLFDQLFSICDVNEWGLGTAHPHDSDFHTGVLDSNGAVIGGQDNIVPSGGGARMGLFSSLFNHSCTPNVTMLDEIIHPSSNVVTNDTVPPPSIAVHGYYFVPRFSRDVAAGEEVTVSYIDPTETDVNVRAKKLGTSYGFRCRCMRCLKESGSTHEKAGTGYSAELLEFLRRLGL